MHIYKTHSLKVHYLVVFNILRDEQPSPLSTFRIFSSPQNGIPYSLAGTLHYPLSQPLTITNLFYFILFYFIFFNIFFGI